jgi:hypothetical protein
VSAIDVKDPGEALPEGFAGLPALVYQDDPRWIPEEPAGLAMAFSLRNPWFGKGRARLFSVPGLARAAAFYDPAATIEGRIVAFFGYWETQADSATDARLLAKVSEWARAQGAAELWGPVNFSTAGNYRLLLSHEPGFVPFPGEPYNPPSYPARLEALGFVMKERYASYLGDRPEIQKVVDELVPHQKGFHARGYTMEPITVELWQERVDEFHQLTNSIYRENLGFVPFSKQEFQLTAGLSLIKKTCPVASLAARSPSGEIVGVVVSYPDYGPIASQGADAERVPASALEHSKHFAALAARPPVRVLTKTVGTSPAHRGLRIFECLWGESLRRSQAIYDQMLGCLIRDGNLSGRVVDRLYRRERTYGLFARSL